MTENEANRKGRPRNGDYEAKYSMQNKINALSVVDPVSGCRVWNGALNDSGYGRMKYRGRFRRAHIVAWELSNGKVPTGLVIDHIICNNRKCINPRHMRIVTQSENCRRGNERRYANDRERG